MKVRKTNLQKSPFTKKEAKFKIRRKCVSNFLIEPQHLAKIKTPKLLKFPRKGLTN